jgi:1-aminocyclopropane-1-carboxylate deaminase/D-cysteine desulfhydrase-like pyridoxal-dependent ACC family enzyme
VADLDTALKLLEIVSIAGGGATIIWRLSALATKFELIGSQQSSEIKALKAQVERLGDVLVRLAEQSGRLDRLSDTVIATGKRLDDLGNRFNAYVDSQKLR